MYVPNNRTSKQMEKKTNRIKDKIDKFLNLI